MLEGCEPWSGHQAGFQHPGCNLHREAEAGREVVLSRGDTPILSLKFPGPPWFLLPQDWFVGSDLYSRSMEWTLSRSEVSEPETCGK